MVRNTQNLNKMPALSAIISSLLSAFDSSRQLFHRIKGDERKQASSKARLRRHPPTPYTTNDEAQSRNEQMQLQRARRQIAKTYEMNSGRYGARYRRGDGMSFYFFLTLKNIMQDLTVYRPRQNIPKPHPPSPKHRLDKDHLQSSSTRHK
jgi:hypothetical protein